MFISGTVIISAAVAIIGLFGTILAFALKTMFKALSDKMQEQTNSIQTMAENFMTLSRSLESFVKKQDHKEDLAEVKKKISKLTNRIESIEMGCVVNHGKRINIMEVE